MKPVSHADIRAAVEQVRPLGDFVLVRRLVEAEHVSRIVIPDSVKYNESTGKPRHGIVVAIGPGDRHGSHARHRMHVAPGDLILYWRTPANDVQIDGAEYTFCHEEQHIVAVLEHTP